jgi:hypothetical protein
VSLREALGHDLSRAHQVSPRLEDQGDRREAHDRLGANGVDPRDAAEQVDLQRHRDELLDLRRRQAERLGLDLDVRRRELRQRVHGHPRQLRDADQDDGGGERHDEQSERRTPTHDRSHGRLPSAGQVVGGDRRVAT